MNKATRSAALLLGITSAIALFARITFPEVQPVLAQMVIIFYLILAVTVIAILRNLLGLITYGVFGPAIVSLGVTIIGDAVLGFAIVLSIIGAGLLVRFLLEPLKLQMTHRMAIVVITIAGTMGMFKFIGFKLGNDPLALASFLPILISAWIVERFVRDRWESGWRLSLRRLSYTLIAVLISFLLISEKAVTTYFINTPEIWILPVAVNVLLGSSVRVRLSEYFRFKGLVKTNPDNGGSYSQVLTMNVRNQDYIEKYNPKQLYPSITKLALKQTLIKAGIPVPSTLSTIETYRDLEDLEKILEGLPPGGFAIKPNNGFGGRGITLIKERNGDLLEKVNGEHVGLDEIKRQLEATIDGEHSGRWLPDQAVIEELVVPDPKMERLSYTGLPDIRVIVFMGVPVMAMTRLPTKRSGGRANLHQGAVGAGIDLVTGKITRAVLAHQKKPITHHPDTGAKLVDEQIPFWDQILELAIRAQSASGLDYVGVDIVIDRAKGPLVMEVNKRPGLEIQNANGRPLLERLKATEAFLAEGITIMRFLESRRWRFPITEDSAVEEEI